MARASGNLRLVAGGAPASEPPAAHEPALDDSELLAALRRADPSAATALHDRVRPMVDRTIARLLGRRDADHEDLAQLAMIELVTTIDRYRGECSLDGWTSMITARVVYKEIRKRQVERRFVASADPEDYVARAEAPTERAVLARSVMQRVRQHLNAVEEGKGWTFLLHDVCGYDLREIAEITGVSVAAAQTRLVRGRREVHERLAADPEISDLIDMRGGAS